MTTTEDILQLEKGFWTEGADFYRQHLDDDCLIAFVGMAGVMGRDQIAATAQGPRWRDVEIALKGIVEPAPGVAILSYEAKATRADGAPYAAQVGSGYVKRDGDWKLAFHQQTPLEVSS
jgi:hypothetical protein